MRLDDIVQLARDALSLDYANDGDSWHFESVDSRQVARSSDGLYDLRAKSEAFKDSVFNMRVIEADSAQPIGNATLFLLDRRQFTDLYFWRSSGQGLQLALEKISLADVPEAAAANRVLLPGYIERRNRHQGVTKLESYSELAMRYGIFMMTLVRQCKRAGIPVLVEVAGKASLAPQLRKRVRLGQDELAADQVAALGVVRENSRVGVLFAQRLGLLPLANVWNERTLGPVYCSIHGA